jgi:hypothetical protein
MVYIVLSVIGIIAVILIRQSWSYKRQTVFMLSFLAIGLLAYIVFDYYFLGPANTHIWKGSDSVLSDMPWLEIGLYFVMLSGMASKYIFDAIGEGNKPVIQKWKFIKPVFISPLVFGIIYSGMEAETSGILLLIFSFQNGFFWQTVLNKTT